jgi:formylglycine-generating enzyme required for sulfatase activity
MVSSLPRTALAVALTLILAPIAVAGTPPAPPPVTSSAHDAASWPLLIGIYQYQDTRIPRLRYAVSDVPATEQVPRGGAWWSVPSSLLSAFRSNMPPSHREQDLGFRCAQTP